MLLQHLRKPVLAALTLLALPGAALATDEIGHSDNVVARFQNFAPFNPISQERCAYLEVNIPGYDCAVPIAEYAGQPDLPEKPDGVDYRFWEENVWELQGDVADAPDDEETEQGTANRPSDRGIGFY